MAAGAGIGLMEKVMGMVFHAGGPDLHPIGWGGVAAAVSLVVLILVAVVTIGP